MHEDHLKSPLSAQEPLGYLEAPALMVTSRNTGEPLAVEQSVTAVQQFQALSQRDLAVVQRELSILSGRLDEVEQQLTVERKMGEAASLLGKLHSDDSQKRKSLFKSNSKRLSRQADEEAKVSKDRISRLEFARTELQARKMALENRLLRHHSAVLSKALSGEPLNPRPLSIALHSNGSTINTFGTPERSPRRNSRRLSTFDFEAMDLPSNIPSVPPLHSNHHSRNASLSTLGGSGGSAFNSGNHDSEAQQELNSIAKRIETALPTVTPNPNKSAFILSALEFLIREQQRNEKVIETLQDQTRQADERVAYLSQKGKAPPVTTTPETARAGAENHQLKEELDQERKRSRELRDRLEAQRNELHRVTKELEDVTSVAVQSESQLRDCGAIIDRLEHVNQENSKHIAEKLGNTLTSSSPSILCKEFRQIIFDLSQKHYNEQRAVRSIKFPQKHAEMPRSPENSSNAYSDEFTG